MTMSGSARMAPIPVDDPDAAPAVEPSPWPVREKKVCHRALLAGSLMMLLLFACFVLGPESASSAAGLQIDLAKLTAMNNGTEGLTTDAPQAAVGGDELLGGLLPAGMDRQACRSRYESWRYYKHFPYTASADLQRKLRAYEARHRRCAPGTPLYNRSVEQLQSGRSADGSECSYVVWLPFDGLGNRMLSMLSGFLYALLTDRVFLVALPPDSTDLFCEPFPGATTWRLPTEDFPVGNVFRVGQDMDRSYTRLLHAKLVGPDATYATAAGAPPAYAYLSLGYALRDPLFFCGEHQRVLSKINWLLLYSDLYFTPSMYAVAEFQDELRRLFPAKESVSHLLTRYLFHPSNLVWSLVTEYYSSYLAPATLRIGLQIRMYGHSSIPADDMYNQILKFSRQEHILPPETTAATGGDASNNSTTAIFIASLYADYYKRLTSRYSGATRVGVFQRTHDERQATGNLAHNQRALAEIYLLSFCEELVTSGLSTFGYVSSSLAGVRPAILHTAFQHKIPERPCVRTVSMEPCNLTPPKSLRCQSQPQVKEDVDRHVRVCEDWKNGVKFLTKQHAIDFIFLIKWQLQGHC